MGKSTETTKHTPGPWWLWRDRDTLQVDAGDGPTGDNGSAVVHWVGFDSGDRPFAEKFANARLIAAAPELLEALEGLLIQTACEGSIWTTHMDKARTAIRKAHGE